MNDTAVKDGDHRAVLLEGEARRREVHSKDVADAFRAVFPDFIAPDDDASTKTLTFVPDTPEAILREVGVYMGKVSGESRPYSLKYVFPEALEYADESSIAEQVQEYGNPDTATGIGVNDPRFSDEALGYSD